jgi:hypothetical protein
VEGLYVIQEGDDGALKIGVSGDPSVRLARLQIGNPRPLTLLQDFPVPAGTERRLHRILRPYCLGGEWFANTREVWAVIESCFEDVVIEPLLAEVA